MNYKDLQPMKSFHFCLTQSSGMKGKCTCIILSCCHCLPKNTGYTRWTQLPKFQNSGRWKESSHSVNSSTKVRITFTFLQQ